MPVPAGLGQIHQLTPEPLKGLPGRPTELWKPCLVWGVFKKKTMTRHKHKAAGMIAGFCYSKKSAFGWRVLVCFHK